MTVGRTLLSFRPALEREIETWTGFQRALRPREQRSYDRMMDVARVHADAGSMANRGLFSEIIFMSILVDHQRRLDDLQRVVKQQQQLIETLQDQLDHAVKEPSEQNEPSDTQPGAKER